MIEAGYAARQFWNRHFNLIEATIRALLIGATVLCLGLSYRFGVEQKYDRIISPHTHGIFWNAVCAVLSHEKYDTGRYICAEPALQSMMAVGLFYDDATLARVGRTLPQLLVDSNFLDSALEHIFSTPPPQSDASYHSEQSSFRPIGWGADAGYQDIVDLSFRIFGHKLKSLYLAFFGFLLISTALFFVQFRGRVFPLFTILSFQYVLFKFLSGGFLNMWGIDTVTNQRFMTTLAIIPLFHVLFLIAYRVRPSKEAAALVIPQAALMILAGDLRTTAYWAVIAVVLYCIVVIGFSRYSGREKWFSAFQRCWPGLAVVTALVCGTILVSMKTDHRLSEIGGTRTHSFWSSVYYSLQTHPDWNKKYAAAHQYTTGDGPAMAAMNAYRVHRNLPAATTHKEVDTYIRGAYVEFFLKDPAYVLETIFYYNGLSVILTVREFIRRLWSALDWQYLSSILIVASVLVGQIRRKAESLSILARCTGTLLLFSILSAGPNWALLVIPDSMGDPALMVGLAIFCTVLLATVSIGVAVAKIVCGSGVKIELVSAGHLIRSMAQPKRMRKANMEPVDSSSAKVIMIDAHPIRHFAIKTAIVTSAVVLSLWIVTGFVENLIDRLDRTLTAKIAEIHDATKFTGRNFWGKITLEIEKAAGPGNEMPPEQREKLLAAIHTLAARWRPFVTEAFYDPSLETPQPKTPQPKK